MKLSDENNLQSVIDPKIGFVFFPSFASYVFTLGKACVSYRAKNRPTMMEVSRSLDHLNSYMGTIRKLTYPLIITWMWYSTKKGSTLSIRWKMCWRYSTPFIQTPNNIFHFYHSFGFCIVSINNWKEIFFKLFNSFKCWCILILGAEFFANFHQIWICSPWM